jgi:chromosome segregation and condensation protein ScpB
MDNIYKNIIEALIFASDDPITHSEIIKAIKGIDGEEIEIKEADIDCSIEFKLQNPKIII